MYIEPHLDPVRYPYLFAYGVVDRFVEKYARATIFIAKKMELPPKELKMRLIVAFMERNIQWQRARELIKRVENESMYEYLDPLTPAEARKYLTYVGQIVTDDQVIAKFVKKRLARG